MGEKISDEVIDRLRDYLKIASVHPDVDYSGCVSFLQEQAKSLDLPCVVYELVPTKPVVVMTWLGTHAELPAILLNSHMDVVPVYEEHWTYPPFGAVMSDDGFIYARGTQDMKGVGMMHLEAIRRLKAAGVKLKRTVHISFVPDEEINGVLGMGRFSGSSEFKNLNIGFALDESMPSTNDVYIAFIAERTSRQIKVTCLGTPGHGSLLESNTAGEKLHYVIDKFMTWRKEEKWKLDSGKALGEVTTINLTKVEGGVQVNVLPESLSASFDIRIAPHEDHQKIEDMIKTWCLEAGDGVSMEYYVKNAEVKSNNDGTLLFMEAIENTLKDMGKEVKPMICPGATDARYIRLQGIPAIGFSAIVNTPQLLHAHDERLHVDVFRNGIDVMEKIICAIANL